VEVLVARGLQPILYEDFETGEFLLTGPAEFDNPAVTAWLANMPVRRLPYDELAKVGRATRILLEDSFERLQGIEVLAGELGLEYRTLFYAIERDDVQVAELLHPNGTKAAALAALAARYGLTMAEVVAVGDGHNDVEMLEEAGLGVAMGQAPPEVRRRAALTIGDHLDEGLAAFIEDKLLANAEFGMRNAE
jgi:hydroxymethylpyrimidine pyrophosphatase-like HAD family hydrolase